MFQPRVDNLFHAERLAAEQVLDIVDMPICVGEPDVDSASKIVETLISHEDANKHGKGGEDRSRESRHQLIRSEHWLQDISGAQD